MTGFAPNPVIDFGDDGPRWWLYVRRSVGDRDFVFARGGVTEDRREIPELIWAAQAEAANEFLVWSGYTHILNRDGSLSMLHAGDRRRELKVP